MEQASARDICGPYNISFEFWKLTYSEMFLAKCNVRASRPTLDPTDDALGWDMPLNKQASPAYSLSLGKF